MDENLIPIYILASIVIFLILSVSIILFLYHSHNKINKIKLHEKEMELKYQNELLLNTVKTQEAERSRIASELHDDIASKLNIIHLNLHLLKKGGHLIETDLKLIDQIETSLDVSIERTRSIAHELLPQIFRRFGIHHALKELEHSINITQVILVRIQSEHLLNILDELKLLHIYRIIQELIQNTLKYASAKNINIGFAEENDMIAMTYTDDGKGFDVKNATGGLGISNIMTRSKLLEGKVTFESLPEIKGMTCTIKFPNHG